MIAQKAIRVLMIGPGEGIGGGISALIENFKPALETKVSLFYLASVKQRPLKDSGKFTLSNALIALSQYYRFISALIRSRPQIIHLHTSQGIAWLKDSIFVLVGKAIGCHVILHMHGGNFDDIYKKDLGIIKTYTRFILGIADAIISVSEEWKNRLALIIPINRIYSFKNCINVQSIPPADPGAPGKVVNILFLGRIGVMKGTYELIDAINTIQSQGINFHVWLVGPEENKGDFQNTQAYMKKYQLSGTCELLGSVDRDKVLNLFKNSSIFVLPSHYEGLPMVILEALAAGLPVVATPVGGIPEVVHDGENGFLIPVGNIDKLACAIQKLAINTDLRKIMGHRGREIAERDLNVDSYVEHLVGLYNHIVGNQA